MINPINILDFIPYFVLVTICWFFAYYQTKDNAGLKVIFWTMLIFSAIRLDVGWDYPAYVELIEGKMTDRQFDRIEWLSSGLMLLARHTFTQLYFIINSVIGMVCIYQVVKRYSVDAKLSLYTFLTFSLFYLMTMNIIRNFTAVLMVMYACSLFLQRKYLFYMIIIFLAAGMHKSAYVGFLIPVIYYFQQGRKFNIILFVTSFLLTQVIMMLILSIGGNNPILKNVIYYIIHNTGGSGKIYQYLIYLINIIFFIYWDRLVRIDPLNKFWLNLTNVGVCFWILFSFQSTLSFRLSLFFIVYIIILIPALINTFSDRYRKLIRQGIMIMLAMLFFLNLYILAVAYNEGKIVQASFLPYNVFFIQ